MQLPDKTNILDLLPARINEVSLVDKSSQWVKDIGVHHPHAEAIEEWYVQCAYHGLISLGQCVEVDPKRRGGVPVLRATRITVAEALGEIAESGSIQDVADNFDIELENLKCLLNSLSLLLNHPYPK